MCMPATLAMNKSTLLPPASPPSASPSPAQGAQLPHPPAPLPRPRRPSARERRAVVALQAWAERQKALRQQTEALLAVVGGDLESPLMRAVYDVWKGYSDAVSREIGDKCTWLEWFELECDMGARPKTVRFVDGTELEVANLADLAFVICN